MTLAFSLKKKTKLVIMKNYICGLWDENEIIFNQILRIRLLIDKQTDEKKP